jgi:small subunit ribosomal protein S2
MANKKVDSAQSKRRTIKVQSTIEDSTQTVVEEKVEGIIPAITEIKETPKFHDRKSSSNSPKDLQTIKDAIEKKINDFFEANKESGLRKLVSASKLMEAGTHVGLPAKYWNPKMKPFIYPKKRNKTQVIDILKTMVFLDRAYNFLRDVSREGGTTLLVGTRGTIIKEHVKKEASRVKCFYINQR